MDCVGRTDVGKLLDGELPPAGVRSAFVHLRECAPCREALEEGRRARRGLKALAEQIDEETPPAEAAGPRFVRQGLFGRLVPGGGDVAFAAHAAPKRRRPLLLLFAVLGVLALVGFTRRGADAAPDAEERAIAAVARGEAAFLAPVGAQEGRPRLATALLAAPPTAARLVVCGPDGAIVWDAPLRPGESGAAVLPHRWERGGAARDAWRFAAPFPDAETLPLAPGVPYAAALVFPGGVIAAGAPFVIGSA